MNYQVLARKWRPRFFDEMVGQEHVLRALINSLNNQQLHHAYLFTGTRGVGKTTIARILAKCLNCEEGISARPCGECGSCKEISEGRFVDFIEVDAASRTRVEDTRELLENVQYAPTRGRFKVYLIDEVHMLSTHSFNALLKTLEEPPPHVKFLLATTDPQKLPVTVLSRCLQFHLKNLAPRQIVQYLQSVLTAEQITFEEDALWQLGRAANGSMRDALTLLDQSISFGSGTVTSEAVTNLLGTPDHRVIFDLADKLAVRDTSGLLRDVAAAAENNPDFSALLEQLLVLFHRLAVAQLLPEAVDNSEGDREQLLELAGRLAPEDVQLYYQVCQQTLDEMSTTPDRRISFEMALIRMIAFSPDMFRAAKSMSGGQQTGGDTSAASSVSETENAPDSQPSRATNPASGTVSETMTEMADKPPAQGSASGNSAGNPASERNQPEEAPNASYDAGSRGGEPELVEQEQAVSDLAARLQPENIESAPSASTADSGTFVGEKKKPLTESDGSGQDWFELVSATRLDGISGNILQNCVVESWHEAEVRLVLDESHSALYSPDHANEIAEALSESLGREINVTITV